MENFFFLLTFHPLKKLELFFCKNPSLDISLIDGCRRQEILNSKVFGMGFEVKGI
jgi:hypothetical protein